MNREDWLDALMRLMAPKFTALGAPLPTKIRMAIGFPSTGAKGKAIAECWYAPASADETTEIFIRPDRDTPMDVASDLAHELIHAALGPGHGHGPKFKAIALQLGFKPPMKQTPITPAFEAWVNPLLAQVGPLPHARLSGKVSNAPKPQKGRMVKCVCEADGCGYTVRTTRQWLDTLGAPICPGKEHGRMTAELPDEEDGEDEGD